MTSLYFPSVRGSEHFSVLHDYASDHGMHTLVLSRALTGFVNRHLGEPRIFRLQRMQGDNLKLFEECTEQPLFVVDVFNVLSLRFLIGLPSVSDFGSKLAGVCGALAERALHNI